MLVRRNTWDVSSSTRERLAAKLDRKLPFPSSEPDGGGAGEERRDADDLSVVRMLRKRLNDDGARLIAERLFFNFRLREIYLSWNQIGSDGAAAIAGVLADGNNCVLRVLSLSNNAIGDGGALALADALKTNVALEKVFLSNCSIESSGAAALGGALAMNASGGLRELQLDWNSIGSVGVQGLSEGIFRHKSLQEVSLKMCKLDDRALKPLSASLSRNRTLKKLDLVGNRIDYSSENCKELRKAVKENRAAPVEAEQRARCMLFCCLRLAPNAHKFVIPSIGAIPVPVMQAAVVFGGTCFTLPRRHLHKFGIASANRQEEDQPC